jgi:predicted ATP-grasp superfamily ATP-dependent carboligase
MTAGPLTQRAGAIGQQVAGVLPSAIGYIGVDLILGDAVDGSEDLVIEINPRMTTSYVGLRASAEGNLASAMLGAFDGAEKLDLRFPHRPLEFQADGTIVTSSPFRKFIGNFADVGGWGRA